MKILVDSLELGIVPGGYTDLASPNWNQIEAAIKQLDKCDGGLDLFAQIPNVDTELSISLRSDSNLYTVEVAGSFEYRSLTNSNTENPEELVGMCDGECQRKWTVDDLAVVIEMVHAYLKSGQFADSHPYYWK